MRVFCELSPICVHTSIPYDFEDRVWDLIVLVPVIAFLFTCNQSSTVICWTSPFFILEVSGLFCRFYFILDGKSC